MSYSIQFPNVEKLNEKKVIFLLGTDKYIGEEGEMEQRVGVTPDQVDLLNKWLLDNGVELDFYFVKGAGINANFPDEQYISIGGRIIEENELPNMPVPDLVHALKEPAEYEENIPGPYMRIGALHTRAFSALSGLATILKKGNFCGIFDGSFTGKENLHPIRKPMSIYAGEIAAEDCIDHFLKNSITDGKVVIFGGGVAGKAALDKLLILNKDLCKLIIIVDRQQNRIDSLKSQFIGTNNISFILDSELKKEVIQDANAVILTAYSDKHSEISGLNLQNINYMSNDSIIIDVSIDEKGCIVIPGFDRFAEPILSKVIERNKKEIDKLNKNITYCADDHMPRRKPHEASIAHGIGVMPYIALLLYYSAKLGSAKSVVNYVLSRKAEEHSGELLQHLRNGLALSLTNPNHVDYNRSIFQESEKPSEANIKEKLESFLKDNEINFGSFE